MDRTGLLAALILLCGGVPREEVVRDYACTRAMLADAPQQDVATIPPGTDPAFYQALLGCEEEAMEMALRELDRLGGARRWLLAAGAAPEDVDVWADKQI